MCRHESEVQIINKVLADQWQGAVHISLSVDHNATYYMPHGETLYIELVQVLVV